MLKIIAILLGALIIISRGFIVLSPARFRSFAGGLVNSNSALRRMGVILLAVVILIFASLDNDISGARAVMAVIGIVSFLGALWVLLSPGTYAKIAEWFISMPDNTLRLMGSIGVGAGVTIAVVANAYY